jgi:hypothetical protein
MNARLFAASLSYRGATADMPDRAEEPFDPKQRGIGNRSNAEKRFEKPFGTF